MSATHVLGFLPNVFWSFIAYALRFLDIFLNFLEFSSDFSAIFNFKSQEKQKIKQNFTPAFQAEIFSTNLLPRAFST